MFSEGSFNDFRAWLPGRLPYHLPSLAGHSYAVCNAGCEKMMFARSHTIWGELCKEPNPVPSCLMPSPSLEPLPGGARSDDHPFGLGQLLQLGLVLRAQTHQGVSTNMGSKRGSILGQRHKKWGPWPRSGLALDHAASGENILDVACSNVNVDEANLCLKHEEPSRCIDVSTNVNRWGWHKQGPISCWCRAADWMSWLNLSWSSSRKSSNKS